MGKKTPLYDCHCQANAKIVDFAGWDMPLHYGSQLQEHIQVRQNAGVFDVSHMTTVDLTGVDAAAFLRYVLANNIDKLSPGKALYTCMLNADGGIIDDLIVYQITADFYRLVVNSGTREKDLVWLTKQAEPFQVVLKERTDYAMLAIQGPKVREKIPALFTEQEAQIILALKPFHAALLSDKLIARTGYTGEEGFEIILPAIHAAGLWQSLLAVDIKPCGLGARDTLRLEAGLNLYGSDMDETQTPLESNLTWTVAFEPKERDFIGRLSLEKKIQQGLTHQLVGLVLAGQGVLRNHQKVIAEGIGEGEITSGSFSPTLNKGIALARVPVGIGSHCLVDIRGKLVPAQVIKPPFIKNGKIAI
jgi:aminomethyltransferase